MYVQIASRIVLATNGAQVSRTKRMNSLGSDNDGLGEEPFLRATSSFKSMNLGQRFQSRLMLVNDVLNEKEIDSETGTEHERAERAARYPASSIAAIERRRASYQLSPNVDVHGLGLLIPPYLTSRV